MAKRRGGLFSSIMGRNKPPRADLDNIFALPSAAISLEVSLGFMATGQGAVAFRVPEGKAFGQVQTEITELLAVSGNPAIAVQRDEYGYTWVVLQTDPPDVSALVTQLHAVNLTLQDSGFGPQLLCAIVNFAETDERHAAMVYLFKAGRFYPFVPAPGGGQVRDNMMELQIRDLLKDELALEKDLARWFPIWGAPGL
ncbi:MAG: PspA-associated protein PspAB [Candidatus Nanopelagicales bacterium]